MYPNINNGLGAVNAGAVIANALFDNPSMGRFFLVGKASTPNLTELKALYPDWQDGTPMFYTTIDAAINSCVANRGDRIIVLPGHTETISSGTALNADIAGIQVVGVGKGTVMPTVTLGTLTSTAIPVSAANVTFKGIRFVANFADIVTVFLLTTAPGFVVDQCEFIDTSSSLNFNAIITTTVSVVTDNIAFTRNKVILLGITAGTTPIKILGTLDRIVISDNYFNEAALDNTSAVVAHGALVVTNLEMMRNRVYRLNTDTATGGILITASSTTNTGVISDNYIGHADIAAAILVTINTQYRPFNNLMVGDPNASGFVLPAIGVN